jgi:hypothetical protein
MNAHEAIMLAVFALVAVIEMKATGLDRPGRLSISWPVEQMTIEPICNDVELTVGCSLAAAG